tara:strand:- start:3756 stop:4955 length:1200 start_codon:yes stop_codon:yes gene_type:complete
MTLHRAIVVTALSFLTLTCELAGQNSDRPRSRDIGINVGIFTPGTLNAITDVDGVLVGQVTVTQGDDVNTGITAIRPHAGNLYHDRVPAAIYVGNGFGKLLGITQVRELGELETPILLTCTLCVWKAADAMVEWALNQVGMEGVRSLNAVVGETNDGRLNNIRNRPITASHVIEAIESASIGPVKEGSVGAGRGTRAFGWKGGIGTSSRILPGSLGGFTVGVLVQSNFGGILTIAGAPVGQELQRYSFQNEIENEKNPNRINPELSGSNDTDEGQGSIMIVVATDAPLSPLKLERLAKRAIMGLARTGSFAGNGSGDYVIAFSTDKGVRRQPGESWTEYTEVSNDRISALFAATAEATQEAIYNSLLKATTVSGMGNTADAIDVNEVIRVLREYNVIRP